MAFTAADVIDTARDRHPSFDPKAQPESVLLRAVQQYARTLASKVVMRRPSALTLTELTTTLPLASFSAGITVPSHLFIESITALPVGRTSPQDDQAVTLLPLAQRTRFGVSGPAAFLKSGVLFLAGQVTDWTSYASVTIRYVAVPTVATTATTLPFADDALSPMVEWLAAFMARRRRGMSDAAPVGLSENEFREAEDTYLANLQRQSAGEDTQIQDVHGDNGGW